MNMICRKSLEPKYHQCCFAVKPTGYEIMLKMGVACNGTAPIYIGKHKPTGHFVAIRKVPLEDCLYSLEEFQHEIKMHKVMDCQNILTYLSTFISADTLWIVMPMMGYGSCMDLIQAMPEQSGIRIPERAIALILREVVNALNYLHNNAIIHRSVCSSHILVGSSGQVVLTGLRSSVNMEKSGKKEKKIYEYPLSKVKHSIKNIKFLAPEVLSQDIRGYDDKSDIYSLGVVACEMANSCTPFSELTSAEILFEKLNGNHPLLLDSVTAAAENIPSSNVLATRTFSQSFHEFVELCCQLDPNNRPTASQLLNHVFFKQIKTATLSDLPGLLEPTGPLTDTILQNQNLNIDELINHVSATNLSTNQIDWTF